MANNIINIYFSNTFGDLVRTTTNIVNALNYFGFQDWEKPSGKMTLSGSGDGFLANTDSVFSKGLRVEGTGSYLQVQNNAEIKKTLLLSDRANNLTLMSNGVSVFANGSSYSEHLNKGYGLISVSNSLFTNNVIVLTTVNTNSLLVNLNISGNTAQFTSNITAANVVSNSYIYSTNDITTAKNLYVKTSSYVTIDSFVGSKSYTDILQANTRVNTSTISVTGASYSDIVQANTRVNTSTISVTGSSYTDILQANTRVNTALLTAGTIGILNPDTTSSVDVVYSNNIIVTTASIKDLTVTGVYTISGTASYENSTIKLSSNTPIWFSSLINNPAELIVNRTYDAANNNWYTSNADAALSWSETSRRWRVVNVSASIANTAPAYRNILISDDISDIVTDTSTTRVPSSRVLTLSYNLATSANALATSANTLANTSFNLATSANTLATSANTLATSANTLATSANTLANTSFNLATSAYNIANNSTITVNGTNGITIEGSPVKLGGMINVSYISTTVKSITGTSNRITANTSTGDVLLSIPQDIHTAATPTFGGLYLNGIGYANNKIAVAGITTLSEISTTTSNAGAIQISSPDNLTSAFMGFNIPGLSGGQAYFGLDHTDQKFKIGGWGKGNFSYGVVVEDSNTYNIIASSANKVTASLTRGNYLTGNNFDGSAATTWAVDATAANTVSKIVARDSSGNFAANTITAMLSGTANNIRDYIIDQDLSTQTNPTFNGLTLSFEAPTISMYDTNNNDFVRHVHSNEERIGFLSNTFSWTAYSDNSGNFVAAADITAYSDEKLKTNVLTIENALEKVLNMRGVSFDRIDNNQKGIGVIAQEMREVIPEVVREDSDGTLSVAYGNIVGVLIEAIKEQQEQINQLKHYITLLEE